MSHRFDLKVLSVYMLMWEMAEPCPSLAGSSFRYYATIKRCVGSGENSLGILNLK